MPTVVVANAKINHQPAWRSVEQQRNSATLSLVDNDLDMHEALERLLDSSKPQVPEMLRPFCQDLHYLLFTSFRYCASADRPSRFGRPGTRGIFYAAQEKETALYETGYWNTRFAQASDGLRNGFRTVHRTVFKMALQGDAVCTLTEPYSDTPAKWSDVSSYDHTWTLGDQVRHAEIDLIRYGSVRDPEHRPCFALFHPRGFACKQPLESEDWLLSIQGNSVVFMCDKHKQTFQYAF